MLAEAHRRRLGRAVATLSIVAVVLIGAAAWLQAVDLLRIDFDEDDYLRAGQQLAAARLTAAVALVSRLPTNP